jgi:hypothetical protein
MFSYRNPPSLCNYPTTYGEPFLICTENLVRRGQSQGPEKVQRMERQYHDDFRCCDRCGAPILGPDAGPDAGP